MPQKIIIADDFDLKKIADSGQCFRVKEMENGGMYRFITGENVLYIRRESDLSGSGAPVYEISGTQDEWNGIWADYFNMDRNYVSIRNSIPENDTYMKNAAECGKGIRILKQDPWEMLISFIISQRKSIPAIKTSIEMICERYGKKIDTEYETIYAFPEAEAIMADTEPLNECKLGYRLRYIIDATRRVALKEIDLKALSGLGSEMLLESLKEVYGVGNKVANCIALFAYGRCELAPVDTWIHKVIDGIYGGTNPFPYYGDVAGIMQQYIFYYALTHKDEF